FDRLHHAFWKFFDPKHPKYVRGNEYEGIDLEYYSMVDRRIGKLIPIFEEGSKLPLARHVKSVSERLREFAVAAHL
ncbi:MAG: hypothetical protein LAO07_18085, partial [Acidobacteriia bacterium]|nr:hypothetical protein [Terriglobia bacterium]